jgi:hypothetical protein
MIFGHPLPQNKKKTILIKICSFILQQKIYLEFTTNFAKVVKDSPTPVPSFALVS